jgi:hypothetical protein
LRHTVQALTLHLGGSTAHKVVKTGLGRQNVLEGTHTPLQMAKGPGGPVPAVPYCTLANGWIMTATAMSATAPTEVPGSPGLSQLASTRLSGEVPAAWRFTPPETGPRTTVIRRYSRAQDAMTARLPLHGGILGPPASPQTRHASLARHEASRSDVPWFCLPYPPTLSPPFWGPSFITT